MTKLSSTAVKSVRLGVSALEDRVVLTGPTTLAALSAQISLAQAAAPNDTTLAASTAAAVHTFEATYNAGGVTKVGSELYILADGHDFVGITAAGAKADGSTGVTVQSNIAGAGTFTGPITKIHVFLSAGSNSVNIAESLKSGAQVFIGSGHNYVHLGSGDSYAWLGGDCNTVVGCNGNDTVTTTGGGESIQLMNGNDSVFINGDGNSVQLGDAANYVAIKGSHSNIKLGNSNATIAVDGGYTGVQGGNGNVTATFTHGHDSIGLGNGNHTISTLCGCGGNFLSLGDGPANVNFGGGNNSVQIGRGDSMVVINGGNNFLKIGDGNEIVKILGNCNTIQLGNGSDCVVAGTNTSLSAGNGTKAILIGGSSSVLLGDGDVGITFRNFTGSSDAGPGGKSIFTTDGGAYLHTGKGILTFISP